MKVLFRGGHLIDPSLSLNQKMDLWVEEGTIVSLLPEKKSPPSSPDQTIDAEGLFLAPGFVDVHTHLREPGQEYKEDIESGTRAAVAGGFTSILCMPNTTPPNDNKKVTDWIQSRAKEVGHCKVYPVGAISEGLKGQKLTNFFELKQAGCVAFSDDGYSCSDSKLFRKALEQAKAVQLPIIQHCEDPSWSSEVVIHEGEIARKLGFHGIPSTCEALDVARTCLFAAETKAKVHLAHLSCSHSVTLLRAFKPFLSHLTAEVTPHHLVLTEEAIEKIGTNAKMNPPLQTQEDCQTLCQALSEGWIDVVATDHAPHTEKEKLVSFEKAPCGVIGLETALLVLLRLVQEGKITLSRLIESLSTTPAKIFGLSAGSLREGMPADIVIFSLEPKRKLAEIQFQSKSSNHPFSGWEGVGRVIGTFINGRKVYGEGMS